MSSGMNMVMPEPLPSEQAPFATVVGIDEAGYGPLLGPLIVSAVAFDVPLALLNSASELNLWSLLKSSIAKRPGKRGSRLAVADSKVLYNSGNSEMGLKLLERAALVFLMQRGDLPKTLRAALNFVCPQVLEQLSAYSWYADADVDLPVHCNGDDLLTQRNALAKALAAVGIRFRGAWVEVLPEGHFNRLVNATRNKAVVLFGLTVRLVQRVADEVGPQPLTVWIDRQGGRIGYAHSLMTAFDDARLEVLEESPERSGYRLSRQPASWDIRFVMKGETHHLPIALASIYSKYIRELFMMCFNRYWCRQVVDLRPTAGYYGDGRRFLTDIDDFIVRQRIDRELLVRLV